jgi:group I intron endonuclease
MGYIYRITNTQTNKVYIGKTVQDDPIKRWNEHKLMSTKDKGGCPALRDAMRAHGIAAFRFEVIIICFDEACDQIEREYIAKYNCIVPNGYNILEGGQCGGGFKGKKHSPETVERLRTTSKQAWKNPEYAKKASERTKKQMAAIDKETHRNRTLNSEKFQKAVKEGRVGGTDSNAKKQISKTLHKYYDTVDPQTGVLVNIVKHRLALAKATGRKVDQFDLNNTFIATYISIAEAARVNDMYKSRISSVLKGTSKTAKGFIWRYHDEGVQNERPTNVIVTPDA